MKSVLCFGDSNTWGSATVERPDGRYGPDERWPGVLRQALGPDWLVTEEGLPGRTTVSDDPIEGAYINGRSYLTPCLLSHRPLDAVIIMLGTNDLKARFAKPAVEIAAGVGVLIDDVARARTGHGLGVGRDGGMPRVLAVAPPPTRYEMGQYAEMFEGAPEKSRRFAETFRAIAEAHGAAFFDAGSVAESSAADGFHLDPEAHTAIGRALAVEVDRLLA